MKYIILCCALLLGACASPAKAAAGEPNLEKAEKVEKIEDAHEADHHAKDEPRPYDAEADAEMDINDTLAAAKEEGKLGLLVFGTNACHDSRGLAAHFEKPRFQTLLRSHYKMTYVDVGWKNRNIDLERKFGVDDIVGTPTVFVTNSDGEVLNLDTAPSWRNAASREEDDIFEYFKGYAYPKP